MFHRLLIPFSMLYGFFAVFNRYLYQLGLRKRYRLEKPVISVGNLSVGGAGKTPVVIAISKYLKEVGKIQLSYQEGIKGK